MKKYAAAFLIVGVVAIASILSIRGHGRYILFVSDEGTVVVNRTDTDAVCDPIEVGKITPGTYTLGSEDDSAGVYTVKFSDTTRLPGRFTVDMGELTIDIMSRGVVYNGNENGWHHKP